MKRIMNAKVCILLILILMIGITFFAAHGTWSWAGAVSWCLPFDDGWGIADGSVGWGGIASGTWQTYVSIDGTTDPNSGSISDAGHDPNPSGAGVSYLEGMTITAIAASQINAVGQDGEEYHDASSDNFAPND